MNDGKITLVAVFYNEEKRLDGYFENLKGAIDCAIVVDCKSEDRTRQICERNNAEVISSGYRYFEPNVGAALDRVKTEWVLIIDADERLSPSLKKEIRQAADAGKADVFFIKRINYLFDGFSTKSTINTYLPRLFRKGALIYEKGMPHEKPKITGKEGKLSGLFYHYAYVGIPEYVKKMEEYLFQMPREYAKSGRQNVGSSERDGRVSMIFGRHGWRMMFAYPVFFTLNLLFRHALILDGMRGIVYSVCGGISAFLEEAAYYHNLEKEKNGTALDWKNEYPDRKKAAAIISQA